MTDHFHPSEFTRCNPPCKKSDMHPDTIARLNRMREIAGIPLVLICAYRSPRSRQGKGPKRHRSAHVRQGGRRPML